MNDTNTLRLCRQLPMIKQKTKKTSYSPVMLRTFAGAWKKEMIASFNEFSPPVILWE